MAITINSGNSAASNGAVGLISTASFNSVAGGCIVVAVVLLDTTLFVASVTDTSGSATYSFVAARTGTGVRIEYWRSDNPAAKTGNVITATLASGTTPMAIAAQQYSGAVGLLTRDADANGTSYFPQARQGMAYSGDYAVYLFGMLCSAGDTITASSGTLRLSAVGAAGAAGVALVDSTQTSVQNLLGQVKLSASREWVAMPVGLQATTIPYPTVIYDGKKPPGAETSAIERVFATKGGGGGILPPAGDGQIFPPPILWR
jgi:hypothetical protein